MSLDIEKFRWRLAETIAWCSSRAKPNDAKDSLRDLWLRPPSFYYPSGCYPPTTVVDSLAAMRAKRLQDWRGNSTVTEPAHDLAGGRLLLFFPDGNLADGAAEPDSSEFFNYHNEPPWDTWLCLLEDGPHGNNDSYRNYLMCWVPPVFIDYAHEGIQVNPEECIQWATEIDTPFIHQLREAGLLG